MKDSTLLTSVKDAPKPGIDSPLVLIVGRANVGKSTLFNRMLGKREAITDSTAGVTRDVIERPFDRDGLRFRLCDSGGFQLTDNDPFTALARDKSLAAAERATLILLLLAVNEVTGEDEELIELMRRHSKKVILLVNKVDNEIRERLLWQQIPSGFGDPLPLSAAHGRGMDRLWQQLRQRLARYGADTQQGETIEPRSLSMAIIGKPNSGKSTLLNYLLGEQRALVSDVAGTTRDSLTADFAYSGRSFQIIDTAGMRRRSKVKERLEYYSVNRAVGSIDQADIVLLMITADQAGISDQDKKIAALAADKGKGVILVLNKWDLLPNVPNTLQAINDRVRYLFPMLGFAPILPLSSVNGFGVDKLLKTVLKLNSQLERRVETAKLNYALRGWLAQNPPPRWSKGHFKIKYITQVSCKPLKFIAFVNRSRDFPKSYYRYLINSIRSGFGYDLAPILLEIRSTPYRPVR